MYIKKGIYFIFIFVFLSIFLIASDLDIYVDSSGSMIGYLAKKDKEISAYTYFFLKLKQDMVNQGILSYDLYEVGGKIVKSSCSDSIKLYGSDRSKYNRKSTNLVGVLKRIVNKGKFSLLVTDSVLSTKSDTVSKNCDTGYDIACIEKAFISIINNGFSVEVIGVKSLFRGKIYSENYRYVRQGQPVINITTPIYRPFFIYVFGKDKLKVKNLINEIYRSLTSFKEKNNLAAMEVRKTKIAGFFTPYIKWDIKLPYQLRQYKTKRKGKKIFEIKGDASFVKIVGKGNSLNHIEYKFHKKIKFNHYVKLVLPFEPIYEKNYYKISPVFYLSVEPKISPMSYSRFLNGDYFIINLRQSFIGELKRRRKGVVNFGVCATPKILKSKKGIWRDWSTEEDNYKKNSEKILNLSSLLEFVRNYSLEKIKKDKIKKNCMYISFRK